MENCIFCKIVAQESPAKIIYEDLQIIAFQNIHPEADVHYLIIPKLHIGSMLELNSSHTKLMGKLLVKANEIALNNQLEGYKVAINTGKKGGQEIFHLHLHLIANR